MSTMMIHRELAYPHKLLRARVARAVVLSEYGVALDSWRVTRRTQGALAACRVFAYIADSMGLRYDDIAELCFWSVDSVRDAINRVSDSPVRLRAEVVRKQIQEHLK